MQQSKIFIQESKRYIENLQGKKFGRLLVLNYVNINKHGNSIWRCRCNCGNITKVDRQCLIKGFTKSCGCLASELRRLKYKEGSFNHLYRQYKKNASLKDKQFKLSKKDFKKLTSSQCYYCNRKPFKQASYGSIFYGNYVYNGIDRINNNKDYIINNCVPCCADCNYAKGELTEKEFLNMIELIYKNRINK